MNAKDPESIRQEVHGGHDLELGLLVRVREWTDVAPWLRLGRTLRIAASPVLVGLTAVVFALWWLGCESFLERPAVRNLSPETLGELSRTRLVLLVGWTLLIWSPLALLLARQGALLAAGRAMMSSRDAVMHAITRTPAAWIASLMPWACVIAIGSLMIVIGWIARLSGGIFLLDLLWSIAAVLVAIPCGILGFGAVIAIPLSWAALANERDPDSLDSLSRGYEALYRRPLRVALYALVMTVLLAAVGVLASGVGWAASATATLMLETSGTAPSVVQITQGLLNFFPAVVVTTMAWSLLGGVYLLLRYDTGGQEVEDLWQPRPAVRPSLPEIPDS